MVLLKAVTDNFMCLIFNIFLSCFSKSHEIRHLSTLLYKGKLEPKKVVFYEPKKIKDRKQS